MWFVAFGMLAAGYHKHPDPQAGEWIAAAARAHARDMAVSAATEAPRVFFRPLKFPEGWAAILTNPGPECRVRLTSHDPVREVDEVLTARRLAPTTVGNTHEIKVLVPAGGVAVVRGR